MWDYILTWTLETRQWNSQIDGKIAGQMSECDVEANIAFFRNPFHIHFDLQMSKGQLLVVQH